MMNLLLVILISVLLVGCRLPSEEEPKDPLDDDFFGEISLYDDHLEGRIPEPTEHLYDNFSDGISSDKWYITNRNWSSSVSNGQRPENVNYTADGLLVLQAHGKYYPDENMRLTGAAILSKETLGAGKYEIAMKVLPHLGVCNAFWTFYYENDNYNHEIDIELPGRKSYENVINTNWVGVSNKMHTSVVTETLSPANDGKWHKYTFEWHTEPKVVRYYVDDVLTAEITTNVPTSKGQLWIGVWFPKEWCGEPNFESDYMLVDWVSYEPYNEPTLDTKASNSNVATFDQYPKLPIKLLRRNYVFNSEFKNDNEAWVFLNDDSYFMLNTTTNKRNLLVFNSSVATQLIDAVYSDYTFRITFKAKIDKGDCGKLVVECLDENNNTLYNGTFTTEFMAQQFTQFFNTFTTVKGTKKLRISFQSIDDSIILVEKVQLNLQ